MNGYRHPDSRRHGDAGVPRIHHCSEGHFRDAIAMNCDSDEAAGQRADNLAKAEAVDIELWQQTRKVATFKRQCVTHEVRDGAHDFKTS
jgi:hypothetical protein